MNKLKFGDSEFDIPAIAQGKVAPYAAQIPFEESAAGKQIAELQKLRQEFDQYRAEQAAYQAAAEHREKVAERRGFIKGFLSSLVASIFAGLVIYYWPTIAAWASSLVQ